MLKDRPLHPLELGPGLNSELVHKLCPRPMEDIEGLGLTAKPVEHEHQPRLQSLAHGRLDRGPPQLRQDVGRVASLQLNIDPALEGGIAELCKPCLLG